MDEPKRHFVEDYPASKIPEELRGDIDPNHKTRVIVEDTSAETVPAEPRFRSFFGIAAHKNTSVEEAVARVRELRDEWD